MHIQIAVAQINATVGDIAGNSLKILAAYRNAVDIGADIMVAPECVLSGYPLEDLVLRRSFMDVVAEGESSLIRQVLEVGGRTALVFGTPTLDPTTGGVMNSAVLVAPDADQDGLRVQRTHKVELPNYGVFDEKRVFVQGGMPTPLWWRGHRLGVLICEDTWLPRVSQCLYDGDADVLISINGSPFESGKNAVRRKVAAKRVSETGLPLLYVNLVGGQDELVFDGGSFLMSPDGGTTDFPEFTEGVYLVGLDVSDAALGDARVDTDLMEHMDHALDVRSGRPRVRVTAEPNGIGAIYRACTMGLRDYMTKQGFRKVVLGMSGGVDSGIVAAMACDALGPDAVTLVRLPSRFSSEGSLSDAESAAVRLGVSDLRTIPIERVADALRTAYSASAGSPLAGVADENVQARARGTILMAISNQEGRVVLSTGNKSEVSVGYATLYGDMCGGFNPIKDLYKTSVWEACRWRNGIGDDDVARFGFLGRTAVVVPEEIIVKPPSAELREGQADTDSLPPYEILDAILKAMIEGETGSTEIASALGLEPALVHRIRRLVDAAEYKRRQAAPGVKITSKLYGRDRRYPIVNAWRG